jgi:hypothetical protein
MIKKTKMIFFLFSTNKKIHLNVFPKQDANAFCYWNVEVTEK